MVMLAAFDVLLARWTGQNDILVGSPVANRTRPELENVIGFFANTLVLRTDVSGDPAFRALLARVRESCLGAYAHQEMPFEKLVEELQPERRMGRNPMFQISFVMQGEATGAGLSFVQVGSPFDVTVYVREAADGALGAAFEYRTDLFEPDTIDRLAAQYLHLVGAIVADPDLPVSKLPLLTADERERMLTLGSATASPYPRDASVHALFEERVDATPNAIAIRSDGAPISYIELDGRANRLAHHLLARGVAPDDVVGVCLERSVDAIIALIATLKVGAAFVPLDLLAPPARLGYVLRNAGVRIVLTHGATADKLPADAVELVRLDVDAEAIASNSAERPSIARTGDDLAYVMYTSGTTGDPKGVAVPHRGIVRLVRGTDYADFGADQVFLQYAPLSFDASTFEIWGALLNGGTLAIAPAGALSLDELDHVLEREGVTTLWLTAAVFHQAVLQRVDMFRGLRQLLAGGDVLSPRAVRTVREAWPDCRLINGYGPTENTTFSCCHPVQAHQELDRAVPIGSPIANSRVYVLDGRREPVPVGVPGELWLAGDGLALGYLGSPELTADRFVTHRFSDDRVERLYRTGDRARWLRDGTIEFMGRVDQQVKLRGFRIEPGEIEATLRRQPGVREAAVLVRGNGNVKRLLAYVTPHDLDAAALREAMRATLPEYMIPAAVVTLERLPTTANGKLDRAALPEPAMPADEASKVAPRNEVERLLVGLWEEVLEQPGIGVRDDFFALGGHSLMAVALFARIEQVLGVALPLATLFRSPTVEALARAITAGRRPSDERSLVPIRTDGHRPPLFAVPGVGGNVLCFHELAAQLPGDRPFFGLQSRGLVADQAPLDRIEEIASAYIAEVREVQPRGPYHLIGACMGGVIAYEMARQLRAEGEAVDLLGLLETWPPHYSMLVTLSASAVPARLTMAALRVTGAAQTLRQLDGGDRLRYVKSRLARVARVVTGRAARGGLSNNERINAVTRANKAAVASYRPEPYDGDAVLILAAERRIASAVDPRLSWRNLVRGRLDVLGVPGEDSGLMLRGDAVRILAERIQGCLDR
jgi:aspartate racemase